MKKGLKDPGKFERITVSEGNAGVGNNATLFSETGEDSSIRQNTSRRDFLKLFGFTFVSAAIIEGCKRPVQKAVPYVIQPPEITPGKSIYYATSFYDGHEYSGILVKTRDGRPIKIEGNKLSAFNGEGTSARVQASVLSLYDDSRLKFPTANQLAVSWEKIDGQIIKELDSINTKQGEIALLTSSIVSPTTIKLIKEFGERFRNFRWVQYDAVSSSAILEANSIFFGKEVIPDYIFGKADLVVSVNADFLGTWISPVHFIPGYISRRKLDKGEKDMLMHVHFESGMSLTGANADIRKKIKPSEEKTLLIDLYNRIADKTGGVKIPQVTFREDLTDLADKLIASKGRSIVISGTNRVDIQIIINGINSLLGNYGECIDLNHNIKIASGIDSRMENLVSDLNNGKVNALFMYNVNPVYDFPESDKFLTGIKKTELVVNMAETMNESVGNGNFECPVHHYLESWDDAEIIPGYLSLRQPCINPLFDTRSFQDSLLKWSGKTVLYHDYLIASWEKEFFPKSTFSDFKTFWNKSLSDGVFNYDIPVGKPQLFRKEKLRDISKTDELTVPAGYEIVISESVSLGNGKHSNNPWLMELPDPILKQCWENVATISTSDAEREGIKTGTLIKIKDGLVLPAFVQPGQTDGTISVFLGYGHTNAGPVCNNIGVNLYPFIRNLNGNRVYEFSTEKLKKTGKEKTLALTQVHYSMEGRPLVRETSFNEYKNNPLSGNELHKEFEESHKTLYPEVEHNGFHWGMAIDLNSCIGCNSCVIACQAENNIPVVGKDEVIRRRIMHWIKIDRYYSDSPDDPKVYFQPLACQHCDNAPCENVCPVSATTHSSEGLNHVTYNRCVGTKYCINNCPYRVRRFNWFRYTNNKEFDFNTASDLGKMILNPDVTVRERGVVEKCSFCVQRIQEKKLQAKLENRTLKDYEIKTACMQACPSGAIVFGNLNDPNSNVSRLFSDPRCYHLLEELHTLPSAGYLTKVRNEDKKNS
jgi:Fe-S-cluster-containing dehydrogenase component